MSAQWQTGYQVLLAGGAGLHKGVTPSTWA
jgi:hypothetical protein